MCPTFSVIIPVLNGEQTIGAAIDSIRLQSFLDFELIIMDGGSSDSTIMVAQSLAKNFSQCNILSSKDRGIYDAMNRAIALSKGEWIYFLGSDDKLQDSRVLEAVNSAVTPDIDVIYGMCTSRNWGGFMMENSLQKSYLKRIYAINQFFVGVRFTIKLVTLIYRTQSLRTMSITCDGFFAVKGFAAFWIRPSRHLQAEV